MNIHHLLNEFCRYSEHIRGYSQHTIARYRSLTGYFLKYTGIDDTRVLSSEVLASFFMHGRVERKWTPSTYISYHKTLIVFFRWCCERGYLNENYAENIECPKLQKRLPKHLTRSQAQTLLLASSNLSYHYRFLRYRNHAIIATFLYTGLRKGELLNLILSDVNLENMTLLVRQGKGAKDRIIPIPLPLVSILEDYLRERIRLEKTTTSFFTSLNRNVGLTETGLKRFFEKLKEATNIAFSAHTLRHTFATLMLEGGCDIYSLSKMMGHNDITTTVIYLSASPEHLRNQAVKHPLIPKQHNYGSIKQRNDLLAFPNANTYSWNT